MICLYALQTIYSPDKAFAARNIGFFLIPFAILFSLLAEANWDRRLLRLALVVLVAEGLILAGIGIGQFATQHIFWNDKLEASNDFHFYFRVNSLFWDPNIYGRYLVLDDPARDDHAGLGGEPGARPRSRRARWRSPSPASSSPSRRRASSRSSRGWSCSSRSAGASAGRRSRPASPSPSSVAGLLVRQRLQ